jgi:hypothetical protein
MAVSTKTNPSVRTLAEWETHVVIRLVTDLVYLESAVLLLAAAIDKIKGWKAKFMLASIAGSIHTSEHLPEGQRLTQKQAWDAIHYCRLNANLLIDGEKVVDAGTESIKVQEPLKAIDTFVDLGDFNGTPLAFQHPDKLLVKIGNDEFMATVAELRAESNPGSEYTEALRRAVEAGLVQ